MNPPKTKRNKEMWEKRQKGLSFREIAKLFDLDVATVFVICKREQRQRVVIDK